MASHATYQQPRGRLAAAAPGYVAQGAWRALPIEGDQSSRTESARQAVASCQLATAGV